MAAFAYRARNGTGQLIEGVVDAIDSSTAATMLADGGLVPVAIERQEATRADHGMVDRLSQWMGPPPAEELATFSRQMHTLLRAGVPITRALAALNESNTHRGFAAVLMDVRKQLESGRELSQAMAMHEKVFGPFYRSLVRVGETTGRLDEVFLQLFDHLMFDKEMSQRVRTALRYPGFVMGAIGIAIVIINLFVVPSFATIYRSFNAQLPVVTRMLIATSDFMVHYWPGMLVGFVGTVVGLRLWLATPSGRLRWDRMSLHIPLVGSIAHKAALARFARSFALTTRAGTVVNEGLTVAARTTDNLHLAGTISAMSGAVERGESITTAARRTGVFTPIVLQMLSVGEESGNLEELLMEVAQSYERDVAFELRTLSDRIEPLLVLVLGILVLILALGVFLPMWDLGRAALGGH